jgi:putrescine aminotransferase
MALEPQTDESIAIVSERKKILDAYRRHLRVGQARLAELMHAGVETRSRGPYVWDERGEQYLDCGGYGVFILGHCHPRVVDAVIEQVRTHPTSTYWLLNRLEAEAAMTLARVAPPGLDHVYFGLSGAEAVETALKLARLNGRRRVIAMENSYHGMTLGALSVTGFDKYRRPFEPLLPGVELIPFGRADALRDALAKGPEACVLLEPVQGEGGVVIPPNGYLTDVERECRACGAFLVFDEVQTGLGRLGTWWGADRERVKPDLLLVGKALSGGVVPVSAVLGSEHTLLPFSRDPTIHTSTFSGAPIAMAAAKAAIEAIDSEGVVTRAAQLGHRLYPMVSSVIAETCSSLVREVRGVGLLIGIEWNADYLALDFLIEMLDRHVLLSHSMNAPRVTRLTPPAILADEDVETLEAALGASAAAVAAR